MGFHTNETKNWTYFKIVGTKKGEKYDPYFQGNVKKGEEYVDLEDKYTSIDGVITKVEHGTYEHDGKTNHTLKVFFEDGDDAFVLQCGFSNVIIGLVNGLLGAEKIGRVHLSVWRNSEGFVNMSVRDTDQNGDYLPWKHKPQDLAAMKIKTALPNGDFHVDNTKLVEFLKKEIDELLPSKIDPLITTKSEPTPEAVVSEEDDDELPF